MSKQLRNLILEDYRRKFSGENDFVFIDYSAIPSKKFTELRRRLRGGDLRLSIVKNTLFEVLLKESGRDVPDGTFSGMYGVISGKAGAIGASKAIVDWIRESRTAKIRCALLGNKWVDETGVRELAKTPPREVLLSMVAGTLQAPIAKTAQAFLQLLLKLPYAFNALIEKKEDGAA